MRLNRQNSRLTFRPRQRGGILPLVLVMGLTLGLVLGLWDIVARTFLAPPGAIPSLAAGEAAFAQGNLTQALNIAQQQVAAHPDDPAALTLLTRALIYRSYSDYNRDSDRAQALAYTQAAADANPWNFDILAVHAFALQANDKPDQASRLAVRVIERAPENMVARLALALAYGKQGLFEAALREAKRGVEISDQRALSWRMDARRVLAITLSDMGQYTDALQAIREAISFNQGMLLLHFEQALYAIHAGKTDGAVSSYYRIIAFDPNNVKARFRLCELSSSLGERGAAIQSCREVTERAPEWPSGWYQLGREYFLQGQYSDAQRTLNRCVTLQTLYDVPIGERHYECWTWQGQAAEMVGDCVVLEALYDEYHRIFAEQEDAPAWIYPPEGPPQCPFVTPTEESEPPPL
jgi:tetratricopeptide (TPR) repeat protein